jgi:hypothetical protein
MPGYGCWTSGRLVLEVAEEYVESDDCARLCDRALVGRGAVSADGVSGGSSVVTVVMTPLSDSRRPLDG